MHVSNSVSLEDRGTLDDMSLSEQAFPLQDGLRYSTLISGEINRDGKKKKYTYLNATNDMSYIKYHNNPYVLFPLRCQNSRTDSQRGEKRGRLFLVAKTAVYAHCM